MKSLRVISLKGTRCSVVEAFKNKYSLDQLIIIADSGLLSKANIDELLAKKYEFILGARIKNESKVVKEKILALKLRNGESTVIKQGDLKLVISYSDDRARKDAYNREKGLKRLEKQLKRGRLTFWGHSTIGLFSAETQKVRKCFRLLNDIQQQIISLNIPNVDMQELSMGMSGDLETAIAEGATIVRVGTAIFGERIYPDSYYWNEQKA